MDRVACRQPQTAYAVLQKSLQKEWALVERVTPDIGMAFQDVEDALWDIFLLALFKGATAHIPRRAITSLPVKQAGISLPNPTRTVEENWTVSCVITGHLVTALRGTAEFGSGDHALLMGKGREEIRRIHAEKEENALGEARAAALKPAARRLGRIQWTGAWLLVPP